MWLVAFVLASSTAIGVTCALAVPSERAIEAALGVGIVLVLLLYSLVLTKQQNVEPRALVMGMSPDIKRSSVPLIDCSGAVRPKPDEDCDVDDEQDHNAPSPQESEVRDADDEQDHPTPPPQRRRLPTLAIGQVSEDPEGSPREKHRDGNERQCLPMPALRRRRQESEEPRKMSKPALWSPVSEDSEGSPRENSIERQSSEESWSADDSYRSLSESTQREILRLKSIKVEETARVSNRQLYFFDTSGKWALFTLRHSKKNPKVVVLELAIQDKKTHKVKNIVFDKEASTLTDKKNTIFLPSEERGIIMKSLNLLCKIASVRLDCVN